MYNFTIEELNKYTDIFYDNRDDNTGLLYDSCYDLSSIFDYIVKLLDLYLAKDTSVSEALKESIIKNLDTGAEDMSDHLMESPIFLDLTFLSTYYLFGYIETYNMKDTIEEQKQYISDKIKHIENFIELLPPYLQTQIDEINQIYNGAKARYKLDFNENLNIKEIAAISQNKEKTIYNAISAKTLDLDDKKQITNISAKKWLEKKIQPSTWQKFVFSGVSQYSCYHALYTEMKDNEENNTTKSKEVDANIKYYLVPVSKSNDVFNANLQKNGNFTIGPKGDEKHYSSFEEALNALVQMDKPYWRRPNENGNWGIVKGEYWVRKSNHELNLEEN